MVLRPELQRAVERLLSGEFRPRVATKRNPKQLELWDPPLAHPSAPALEAPAPEDGGRFFTSGRAGEL
jgi:hypothetical protein